MIASRFMTLRLAAMVATLTMTSVGLAQAEQITFTIGGYSNSFSGGDGDFNLALNQNSSGSVDVTPGHSSTTTLQFGSFSFGGGSYNGGASPDETFSVDGISQQDLIFDASFGFSNSDGGLSLNSEQGYVITLGDGSTLYINTIGAGSVSGGTGSNPFQVTAKFSLVGPLNSVPEPSSLVLMTIAGAGGLIVHARRRGSKRSRPC